MHRKFMFDLLLCVLILCSLVSHTSAQTGASNSPAGAPAVIPIAPGFDAISQSPSATLSSPLTQPTLSPGALLLLELDGKLSQSVATGGGKAFGAWFTDDAVTLNNGRPAVYGRTAITEQAQWDPKVYQLTWTPQGAQMGPSNDMGFSWGHYEGHSKDKNGEPVTIAGRYISVWKKLPNGDWKIALEASANDTPATADCCALPKP